MLGSGFQLSRSSWLALALALASCSVVVDKRSEQCSSDDDCARFSNARCDTAVRLCIARINPADAGRGAVDAGSERADPTVDAGAMDAAGDGCQGPTGCFRCRPTVDSEYLNACTGASCKPFDNAARLRNLGPDGGLLPLPAAIAPMTANLPRAGSAVDCAALDNPVYVTGSSAIKPFVAEIGRLLVNASPPVTLVYQGPGSCVGVAAILDSVPLSGAMTHWDSLGVEQSCTLETDAPSTLADIGVSDVFATTCRALPGGLPSNVGDFLGPVQTMTFVVPKASTQVSISAEAAYYVYGFGKDSGAEPWTSEAFLFQRDELSGTQRMMAAGVGVDAARWRGVHTGSTADLRTRVSTSSDAERTLGILSADVAQESRATLTVLAYQHFGQRCGFYPDLDVTSNEKQNVRDGHYALWGPLHLFTVKNNSGYPRSPLAADIIGFMTGAKRPPLELDLIALEAQRHVIPQCAMRVRRSEEIGPLASFAPPQSCGCYFDKVANGSTACTPCSSRTDCPSSAPLCSYGYCETN